LIWGDIKTEWHKKACLNMKKVKMFCVKISAEYTKENGKSASPT
jgi:hypothetical protein